MCWTDRKYCTEPRCSNILPKIVIATGMNAQESKACLLLWAAVYRAQDTVCRECIKAERDESYKLVKALKEELSRISQIERTHPSD